MRIITYAFIFLLFCQNSFGGDGTHGGDSYVCFKNKRTVKKVRRLYEEGRDPFTKKVLRKIKSIRLKDLVENKDFEPLEEKDLALMEKRFSRYFETYYQLISPMFSDVKLKMSGQQLELRDEKITIADETRCISVQLARQDGESGVVFVSKKLYDLLPKVDQMALDWHEKFLRYYSINGAEDSLRVRQVISKIFSKKFVSPFNQSWSNLVEEIKRDFKKIFKFETVQLSFLKVGNEWRGYKKDIPVIRPSAWFGKKESVSQFYLSGPEELKFNCDNEKFVMGVYSSRPGWDLCQSWGNRPKYVVIEATSNTLDSEFEQSIKSVEMGFPVVDSETEKLRFRYDYFSVRGWRFTRNEASEIFGLSGLLGQYSKYKNCSYTNHDQVYDFDRLNEAEIACYDYNLMFRDYNFNTGSIIPRYLSSNKYFTLGENIRAAYQSIAFFYATGLPKETFTSLNQTEIFGEKVRSLDNMGLSFSYNRKGEPTRIRSFSQNWESERVWEHDGTVEKTYPSCFSGSGGEKAIEKYYACLAPTKVEIVGKCQGSEVVVDVKRQKLKCRN